MDVDVSELNKLAADLGAAGPKAIARSRIVVQLVCADTKRDAQAFCPVDTGNLRNSISYETDLTKSGARGEVGPTASYAAYVEFGTSRMAPHAFMGPAFDRHSGEFVDAIAQILDGAL